MELEEFVERLKELARRPDLGGSRLNAEIEKLVREFIESQKSSEFS